MYAVGSRSNGRLHNTKTKTKRTKEKKEKEELPPVDGVAGHDRGAPARGLRRRGGGEQLRRGERVAGGVGWRRRGPVEEGVAGGG